MQEQNAFIKLENGDMLVATITNVTDTHVDLKNPHLIVPSSETSIGFINYNPYGTSDTIQIAINHILFTDELNKQVEDGFKQMFSKIITPDKKIIT